MVVGVSINVEVPDGQIDPEGNGVAWTTAAEAHPPFAGMHNAFAVTTPNFDDNPDSTTSAVATPSPPLFDRRTGYGAGVRAVESLISAAVVADIPYM